MRDLIEFSRRIRKGIFLLFEEMSTTSTRSSCNSKSITSKPWFLTCVDGDVFGWKDGARLKLKHGQSAGRVKSVSVLSADEGLVSVCFSMSCVTGIFPATQLSVLTMFGRNVFSDAPIACAAEGIMHS